MDKIQFESRREIETIMNAISKYVEQNSEENENETSNFNERPQDNFIEELYKKRNNGEKLNKQDEETISKIHKAISIIQFKVEGNLIKKHPEYKMGNRLFLDRINYNKGIVEINGKKYVFN